MIKKGAIDGFMLDCFFSNDTDIAGYILWVAAGEYQHKVELGPRLFVCKGSRPSKSGPAIGTVSISAEPKLISGSLSAHLFAQIEEFIAINRDILISYWRQDASTVELVAETKPIVEVRTEAL